MKFERGDIVRLRSEEGIEGKNEYVVLGIAELGFEWQVSTYESVWRPNLWRLWQIGLGHDAAPVLAFEMHIIETGKRATEVKS